MSHVTVTSPLLYKRHPGKITKKQVGSFGKSMVAMGLGVCWNTNNPNKQRCVATKGSLRWAGTPSAFYGNTPPKVSNALPRIFTGHHWGSLGTAGIAGMAPPHLFVGTCPEPEIGGVGAGMAVAFLDCIPKTLPHGHWHPRPPWWWWWAKGKRRPMCTTTLPPTHPPHPRRLSFVVVHHHHHYTTTTTNKLKIYQQNKAPFTGPDCGCCAPAPPLLRGSARQWTTKTGDWSQPSPPGPPSQQPRQTPCRDGLSFLCTTTTDYIYIKMRH